MNHRLLAVHGLKWNPFSPDVPVESLWNSPRLDHFRWRMESQVREGGFVLVTGEPGTGKSVAVRQLAHHLTTLPDVHIAVLTRPQSALADFYREIGQLFGIALVPHNRWAGFRALREKWLTHVQSTHHRPVLVVDEAQEVSPLVLAEMRILASADFDSRSILTVVLAGDGRLVQQLRRDELLPIASRIRVRLNLDFLTPKELLECLRHVLTEAGNSHLMTPELMTLLTDHAAGNLRVLSSMANELLALAVRREIPQLDQKLYFEAFATPARAKTRSAEAVTKS